MATEKLTSTCKTVEPRDLTSFIKLIHKRPKLKCKILKFWKIAEENLDDLGYSDDFSAAIPKAKSIKDKVKLDFSKIKNFCSMKGIVKKKKNASHR